MLFIQPDTIVPNPGNPKDLNRYAYAWGNPLRYTDPTGHCIPGEPGCQPDLPAGNPYGIDFTTDAGQWWDVRDQNAIFDAAGSIASSERQSLVAYQQAHRADYRRYGEQPEPIPSATAIFMQAFGIVTINRNAGNCGGGTCWAWSNNPVNGTIQVYVQNVGHGHYTAQNAAHELGHIFDRRTGNNHASADLQAEWNANRNFPRRADLRNGFAGPAFGWQQSRDTSASEEFADMFLGWAYNRWQQGDNGVKTPAGNARSQWMTTNMAYWIALASAR